MQMKAKLVYKPGTPMSELIKDRVTAIVHKFTASYRTDFQQLDRIIPEYAAFIAAIQDEFKMSLSIKELTKKPFATVNETVDYIMANVPIENWPKQKETIVKKKQNIAQGQKVPDGK